MKEVINRVFDLLATLAIAGTITFGASKSFDWFYHEVRTETIQALKRPQPSLERFTQKLTHQNKN